MATTLFDHPELYRTLLESLPIGVYILDRERRVRFWNRRAEHLTGHLAHEAMGRDGTDHLLKSCDSRGRMLSGGDCPVTATLNHGHARPFTAFYLHKNGHRFVVRLRTHAILEHSDVIVGAIVLFEEAAPREETSGPALYGCLDPTTGIPSARLTRAVLAECMAGMEQSQQGFGMLRIRVLGQDEFRSKHGLRHSLDSENFLGRWGEDEFIAVLPSASLVAADATAEKAWGLVSRSEVSWWGDRFPMEAVVSYTVARRQT